MNRETRKKLLTLIGAGAALALVAAPGAMAQGTSGGSSGTSGSTTGNTSGSGVPGSGFQVLDDLRLDLNEGPTNFDRRHNFSGEPFSLFNGDDDPDRNGSTSEPLDAGTDAGTVGKTPTPSRPGRANATGQRV